MQISKNHLFWYGIISRLTSKREKKTVPKYVGWQRARRYMRYLSHRQSNFLLRGHIEIKRTSFFIYFSAKSVICYLQEKTVFYSQKNASTSPNSKVCCDVARTNKFLNFLVNLLHIGLKEQIKRFSVKRVREVVIDQYPWQYLWLAGCRRRISAGVVQDSSGAGLLVLCRSDT
jgi:hypothetical protein